MGSLKKWIGLASLSFIVLMTGCGSTRTVPEVVHAQLSPNDKFTISQFDFTLSNTVNVPDLLREAEFREIVLQGLEDGLQQANLLADKDDPNAKPLHVRATYMRRFIGDGTPIPTWSLREPLMSYSLTEENAAGEHYIVGERDLTQQRLLFKQYAKEIYIAYKFGYYMADSLLQTVSNKKNHLSDGDVNKKRFFGYVALEKSFYERSFDPVTDRNYIPDSVIDPLLTQIRSSDYSQRMDGYEKIQEQWFNSPQLFDYIVKQIEAKFISPLSDNEKEELEAQIETIAQAGLKEYLPVLEKVAQSAVSPDIREMAVDAIETLRERHLSSFVIHQPLPDGIVLSWQEQQLYNMTRATAFGVDNVDLQKRAVKEIYRHYLSNEVLLDVVSKELENATNPISYRTYASTDYYAWACRVLGKSGKKRFKPQLERLAQTAVYEKVREFAEEYAEEL
ncbi:hypothetical protein VST7929_02341 [Vibrio stylophorae]|uniref:Lipoprotein n=1 Tax=Vibrio stylophorae TaxID=659351 RepID=A0ABM8ZVP5_9VIBR|nr:hypothetical protein [Vibrio stylophorae]CAH0534410.1 hypothetical protein VST7929_02341 [Vibrio stylophorae]